MRYTVNCSIMLSELSLSERLAAVHTAGIDAVELWWPFADAVPGDAEVDAFVAMIRDSGLTLTGLNLFAGDMAGGDNGLVSWPGREAEFRDSLEVSAAIAEACGVEVCNALYGNALDGVSAGQQREVALENLAAAAELLGARGTTVLVEPLSGKPRYPLTTFEHAAAVVAQVRGGGASAIAVLADFYHLAVNGDDVDAVIDGHAADFGHVQIADTPGRGAPGTGSLPLLPWAERSVAAGYTGRIGLEYRASAAEAFSWMPEPA